MADAKITELAATTTPALTDIAPIVVTPGTTPTNKKATLADILKLVYPVGSIYINSSNATNPATLLGFGTWVAFGAGKVPVGYSAGETEFNAAEKIGGAKTHQLDVTELPAHNHSVDASGSVLRNGAGTNADLATGGNSYVVGSGDVTGNTGSWAYHNNLQPYITVYMWKRTA